jgi:hypothetical protein
MLGGMEPDAPARRFPSAPGRFLTCHPGHRNEGEMIDPNNDPTTTAADAKRRSLEREITELQKAIVRSDDEPHKKELAKWLGHLEARVEEWR